MSLSYAIAAPERAGGLEAELEELDADDEPDPEDPREPDDPDPEDPPEPDDDPAPEDEVDPDDEELDSELDPEPERGDDPVLDADPVLETDPVLEPKLEVPLEPIWLEPSEDAELDLELELEPRPDCDPELAPSLPSLPVLPHAIASAVHGIKECRKTLAYADLMGLFTLPASDGSAVPRTGDIESLRSARALSSGLYGQLYRCRNTVDEGRTGVARASRRPFVLVVGDRPLTEAMGVR